ncbi:MAG TPA: YesL family protein [Candidatus Pullichristensenella avicola]|nr:YesL family protein [Candidatus Pullichristensenella avicola]
MRRWYEPRRDRPDLTREAVKRRGFLGFMETLWREFFELIKLNLLFLLACVPVVTIPAAVTGMCGVVTKMARDKNHFLWPDFWKAFKRDFGLSLLGGLIYAAALAVFSVSTAFYYRLMATSMFFVVLAGFSACLLLLALCSAFYFFPMLATVDLPLRALLKNALVLTFTNYKKTLPALGWSLLLLVVGVGLLPYSVILVLFILFALIALVNTYLVYPAIAREVLGESDEQAAKAAAAPKEAPPAREMRSAGIDELVFDDEEKGGKEA